MLPDYVFFPMIVVALCLSGLAYRDARSVGDRVFWLVILLAEVVALVLKILSKVG